MRKIPRLTGIFVLTLVPLTSSGADNVTVQPSNTATLPSYSIGAGDVLQITVWKEPEASVPSVIVRADGKISIPLAKEMVVENLTPVEAEALIKDKLTPFIRDAEVSVVVRESHSKKIYLVGAVKHEGPIALTAPLSVMQAISEAGGLTNFAKTKRIYVLRKTAGRTERLPFDYNATIRGIDLQKNFMLVPNDMVVIPQ
jgi:polysaccharide export outer membrane protein